MNTPKTPKPPKRWEDKRLTKKWGGPQDDLILHDVESQEVLAKLGAIVVRFGHLEQNIRFLLARLLSTQSYEAAGIVLDSIISPRARITLLKRLLTEAEENASLPAEWDALIDEYDALNKIRNSLVHGLWYTSMNSTETFVAPTDGEGFAYLDGRKITADEIQDIADRMRRFEMTLILDRNRRG